MILNLFGIWIIIVSIVVMTIMFFRNGRDIISVKNGYKWGYVSWISSMFVAGMAVSLFCNIPSDINNYVNHGYSNLESAIILYLYDGLPVWAIYSMLGIFYIKYPNSKIGKISVILSTVFGIAISMYTGCSSVSRIINTETVTKVCIVLAIIVVSIISCYKQLIKKVSVFSIILMIIYGSLVMIFGTTNSINYSFDTNKVLKEFCTSELSSSWAWWTVAWAPVVGSWIARVSDGRTIREYIGGALVSSIIGLIWIIISMYYSGFMINKASTSVFSLTNPIDIVISSILFIVACLFLVNTLDSNLNIITRLIFNDNKIFSGIVYIILTGGLAICYLTGIIPLPWSINMYLSISLVPVTFYAYYSAFTFKGVNNYD